MDSIYMRRRRARETGMGGDQVAARHGNERRMFSLKIIVWPRAAETSNCSGGGCDGASLEPPARRILRPMLTSSVSGIEHTGRARLPANLDRRRREA